MFGNSEQKLEHLVKAHQWEKISKKISSSDAKTRLAAAEACGSADDEEAANLLVHLLRDSDKAVQLMAVKSIGQVGGEAAKTHLQQLLEQPGDSDELKAAIKESILEINRRR